jgi:hypothetical protein
VLVVPRFVFGSRASVMKLSRLEAVVYLLLFALSCVVYFTICSTVTGPAEVFMPAWVPFMPILAIPYLLQVVGSYVMALAISDRTLRRATIGAYFLSYAVTCLVWYSRPTIMYRPPVPAGWWNWPYSVMSGLDLPVSVLPAGHILMPVLVIWAFSIDRPKWLWWLVPAEVLGAVAIVGTWQHRPMDVVIGVVLAIASGLVFGMGRKRATTA